MVKIIGVRFRTAGKVYYFSPGKTEPKAGDKVIVETARGVEFGTVVLGPKEVEEDKITPPLKSVIRERPEGEGSLQDLPGEDPQARAGDEADRRGVYL